MSATERTRTAVEPTDDPRVDLAIERTELALERTQLAWVRTVFGLYTAGIALDKGLEALHDARVLAGTNWASTGHISGSILAMLGTLFAMLTTIPFIRRSRALARMKRTQPPFLQPTVLLSVIASAIGVILTIFILATG